MCSVKVLILQSELGVLRGGGENFSRNLFAAFAERGHQVAAAFVADRSGRYPIPLPSIIEPIPIPGRWSRKLGQATLSGIGRYFPFQRWFGPKWNRVHEGIEWRTIRWHDVRFQRRVERDLTQRWSDFDAIYVHGNVPLASRVAQYTPTILRLPGPVTADLVPVLRTLKAVCANGDAFVRIREFLGDHVIELPIGLDDRIFIPGPTMIRSALGWTEQHRVIGYVGRLTHLKGVDLLCASFHEVSQLSTDVRLLIIGSGEEERQIRHILAKELAHRVVHIEPDVNHDQLPEWYRAMDILVMPSRYENFSNAVLEAMACGVAFLGSDRGGNRILADTGGGWLFEPHSISALSASIGKITTNRTEMKARGNIGRRYVHGRYSWEASAERLEQIIVSRLLKA
jgi:glycosyltransferase involved in cell wall biosynthesis